MVRKRVGLVVLMGWALVALLPGEVQAQSAIAGIVRDSTGGVLPGVTMEVNSPALIEKVRTAVSDAAGQFLIVDLRPGT